MTVKEKNPKPPLYTWRPDGLWGRGSFKENWRRVWWRNEGKERRFVPSSSQAFPLEPDTLLSSTVPLAWGTSPLLHQDDIFFFLSRTSSTILSWRDPRLKERGTSIFHLANSIRGQDWEHAGDLISLGKWEGRSIAEGRRGSARGPGREKEE